MTVPPFRKSAPKLAFPSKSFLQGVRGAFQAFQVFKEVQKQRGGFAMRRMWSIGYRGEEYVEISRALTEPRGPLTNSAVVKFSLRT